MEICQEKLRVQKDSFPLEKFLRKKRRKSYLIYDHVLVNWKGFYITKESGSWYVYNSGKLIVISLHKLEKMVLGKGIYRIEHPPPSHHK